MVAIGGSLLAARAMRLDPYFGFNFLVEIEGLIIGGFREVRGLESSVSVKEYAEGGLNGYMHKIPGETRYPNLTLTRGLTDIGTMWNWYSSVTRGIIKRRNLTIMVLDAQRDPAMWWDVADALPVKWTGPTFDAMRGAEAAVETIELVHRGIEKPTASQALSMARLAMR